MSKWDAATSDHSSPEYKRNRAIVRNRDEGFCVRCRVLLSILTPAKDCDHYTAQAHGGTHSLDNLWMLCKRCHTDKTVRESKGGSGFTPFLDYTSGYYMKEPDWLAVIAERNRAYFAR